MKVIKRAIFTDRDGGCWLCHFVEKDEGDLGERFRWARNKYFRTIEEAMQKHPDIEIKVGTPPGLDPECPIGKFFK